MKKQSNNTLQKSLTALLTKLMEFKTVSEDKEENYRCLQFVKEELSKVGLATKLYTSDGYTSLLAAKTLKKKYRYLLIGHIDIVPAVNPTDYQPVERNGRVYGRGSLDMKGPDAVIIQLMKVFHQEKKSEDIGLLLTTDEEIGGYHGIKYMVDTVGIQANCVINLDNGTANTLAIGEKGILHIKMVAKGKAAHGSRPWLGENAVVTLLQAYQAIADQLDIPTINNNWLPTVNLGKISGGKATNSVPASAEMYLDFRFPHPKDKKNILFLLEKITKKYPSITYTILVSGTPVVISPQDRYLQKFITTAKEENLLFTTTGVHGGSDSRFFPAKTSFIMFRPKASDSHIEKEWVDIKSLVQTFTLLYSFLTNA